ncbi:pyrroline-5-carboxylate reductase [Candidatus Woesearchaeota archaeon]|nr:pyrroline-5-carboxylate reductase [Candidatus Woesearchaeota archaeon]
MRIGIIGAGNLGKAVIDGLKGHHDLVAGDVWNGEHHGVPVLVDNRNVVEGADVVVLTVKPGLIPTILEQLKEDMQGKPVISMAAGVPLEALARMGVGKAVRAMPNMAIRYREGVTGYAVSEGCPQDDKEKAEEVLGILGTAFELPEEQLDTLTALSGSGVAYLLSVARTFITTGEGEGIGKETAAAVMAGTFRSAAKLLEEDDVNSWLERIASAGGTTEQGLKAMEEGGVDEAMKETLTATVSKCQDLSNRLTSQKP